MTRLNDPDGGWEWESEGLEPSRNYDPLFDPWPEAPAAPAPSAFDDDLFGVRATLPPDEEAFWARPYTPASPDYPDRGRYAERFTELQRQLRETTITVPRPERRWSVTVRELAETLILAILIFLAVRASFQNFRVEGASMQPSLEHGEYLIVNKLSYAEVDLGFLDWIPFFDSGQDSVRNIWGSPNRGDVVVFRAPTAPDRDFIKRVIGVPGDTIEIDESNGTVLVNGQALTEPYTQGSTRCGNSCVYPVPPAGSAESRSLCGSEECYFVMGDNRQNSSDSRQGWYVPKENIIGKALVTYWHQGGPELGLAPNHSVGLAEESQD